MSELEQTLEEAKRSIACINDKLKQMDELSAKVSNHLNTPATILNHEDVLIQFYSYQAPFKISVIGDHRSRYILVVKGFITIDNEPYRKGDIAVVHSYTDYWIESEATGVVEFVSSLLPEPHLFK